MVNAPVTNRTGTWAIAQMRDNSGKTFIGGTLRQIVRVSVGGKSVRLKLLNLYGTQPLRVEEVHLALRRTSSSLDAVVAMELWTRMPLRMTRPIQTNTSSPMTAGTTFIPMARDIERSPTQTILKLFRLVH
jgi:hypothetical protein